MTDSAARNLYEVPVRTLGISPKSIHLLKMVGAESVGDCLDFQRRGADALIQVPYGLLEAFESDVLPRLRENGYLLDAEDAE
ncbi:MAG: hypothetical protein H6671_12815 [Anaerolineaceae bacterium]|nr:hypothetical protein [Anaerolineaceae bacterium]